MSEVRARIRVKRDHSISGIAPPDVPAGEHEIVITVAATGDRLAAKQKLFNIDDLPSHDMGPWPDGLSLRREDIYDEDGR